MDSTFLSLLARTLPLRGSVISAMIWKVFRCLAPPVRGVVSPARRAMSSQTEIITVGVQTLPWRKNVAPAKRLAKGSHVTPFLSNIECALNTRKKLFTKYRVVGGTATRQEAFGRMTKKLTASVPSTMNFKMIAALDLNMFTVGVKRFSSADVPGRSRPRLEVTSSCPEERSQQRRW